METILEGVFVLSAFGFAFALAYVAQKVRDAGRHWREFARTLDKATGMYAVHDEHDCPECGVPTDEPLLCQACDRTVGVGD